ncbi:MAG: stage V sporulation protein AC [Evtepia sp.]
MDQMNKEEYQKYVASKSKSSPIWKNMIWAFVVGGLICTIGQGLNDWYVYLGLDQEQAGMLVSVTLIGLSALLTGFGIFDNIAKHAGAGTLVPITGFANAMVAPALEFQSEGAVAGTAVKLFSVAGPVLVFGISASVIYGIILEIVTILR